MVQIPSAPPAAIGARRKNPIRTSDSMPSLGPIALRLLQKRYPARRAPASDAKLAKLHAPAIAFERAYGSLELPDYGEGRSWRKSNVEPWIIGPVACLEADISFSAPGKKKLVPVLYTTNDVAYYLAADGVAWAEDTIEDEAPQVFAPNTRAMMTRILFGHHVFFCPATKKVDVDGAKGAAVARALKLRAIADATDATERWWSDGTSFVVEYVPKRGSAHTTIAYAPKGVLRKIGIEAPAPKRAPKGPITFDTVMQEYADVSATILLKSKSDAVYAAFFTTNELRIGAHMSLGGGKYVGTIHAIDDSNPLARRVRLHLAGAAFKKGASRVEVFFRSPTDASTVLNVFQFGVKERDCDATQEGWFAFFAGLEATLTN